MKKLILFLLIVVFMSVFIYALTPLPSNQYNLNEGWNLVYGLISPNQILDGDIVAANIKAIYAFVPNVQKYGRLYPIPVEGSTDLETLRSIDDDELVNTAFWVYSDKAGIMWYRFADGSPQSLFQGRKLYQGWNFVGVTYDMIETPAYPQLKLNDLKGNCNIEKAYVYLYGQWSRQAGISLPMEDTLLYNGIVVKVTNDCQLGMRGNPPPSPPPLP